MRMQPTRIEITGTYAVTADVERDPADPSGDGRIVVYFGSAVELRLTPETADQLGDALADLVHRGAVVYRS